MKKLAVILLCFVYLVSSAGIHINLHYCGGKIRSVSLTHSDEADCCGRKMKKKDCCKEKSIHVQVKNGQGHAEKQVIVKSAQVTKDIIAIRDLPFVSVRPTKKSTLAYREPPGMIKGRLFLSVGVLRI